jgi:hypothetical protein
VAVQRSKVMLKNNQSQGMPAMFFKLCDVMMTNSVMTTPQ